MALVIFISVLIKKESMKKKMTLMVLMVMVLVISANANWFEDFLKWFDVHMHTYRCFFADDTGKLVKICGKP